MKELKLRIYYEDTDAGGVVYHANYLKFVERGRTEYLRELGFNQTLLRQEHDILFMVHSLSANFFQSVQLDGQILVQTMVEKIRPASLIFRQKVITISRNQVLFTTLVKVVCVKAQSRLACPIPNFLLSALKNE